MQIFRLKYSITFQVPIEAETEEQARAKLAESIFFYLHKTLTKENIGKHMETW